MRITVTVTGIKSLTVDVEEDSMSESLREELLKRVEEQPFEWSGTEIVGDDDTLLYECS
jgi:hypothetical protein